MIGWIYFFAKALTRAVPKLCEVMVDDGGFSMWRGRDDDGVVIVSFLTFVVHQAGEGGDWLHLQSLSLFVLSCKR